MKYEIKKYTNKEKKRIKGRNYSRRRHEKELQVIKNATGQLVQL